MTLRHNNEIEVSPETADILRTIALAGDDPETLVDLVNLDPRQFAEYMGVAGLDHDADALALLRAGYARAADPVARVYWTELKLLEEEEEFAISAAEETLPKIDHARLAAVVADVLQAATRRLGRITVLAKRNPLPRRGVHHTPLVFDSAVSASDIVREGREELRGARANRVDSVILRTHLRLADHRLHAYGTAAGVAQLLRLQDDAKELRAMLSETSVTVGRLVGLIGEEGDPRFPVHPYREEARSDDSRTKARDPDALDHRSPGAR